MIIAPLLWSTAGLVTRHLDQTGGYEVTFWRSVACAVGVMTLMIWRFRGPAATSSAHIRQTLVRTEVQTASRPLGRGALTLWLSFLGIFQLAVPCLMMVQAGRVLAPHQMALMSLLEVVCGPLWVWLSLELTGIGERPDNAMLQGMAIVVAALLFNELVGPVMRQARSTTSL